MIKRVAAQLMLFVALARAFKPISKSSNNTYRRASTTMSVEILPKLVVFDLDMCMWSPEMYELSEIPQGDGAKMVGKLGDHGEGCVGAKSSGDVIRLFPDALAILQDFYAGKYGSEMRIAAASSADTPQAEAIGKAAMNLLEVVPGVTMREVFAKGWPEGFNGNMQIGRQPPLSSNKAKSHFPFLQRETGIEYQDMIFFDDCNWGDHCANVANNCPGVITERTPRGMTITAWESCLRKYAQKNEARYGALAAAVEGDEQQMVVISGAGEGSVNGEYSPMAASIIPRGFKSVCQAQGWDTKETWDELNAGATWYSAKNGAYIYYNQAEKCWWIDAPRGYGAFKVRGVAGELPPTEGWMDLGSYSPLPRVSFSPAPASVDSEL